MDTKDDHFVKSVVFKLGIMSRNKGWLDAMQENIVIKLK